MNMLILAKRVLLAASIVAWPLACGGSDENTGSNSSPSCVEGLQEQCDCEMGGTGIRICDAAGAFGECACAVCGNGTIDTGEECDGANLNGETCAAATMNARPQGTPTCDPTNCVVVVSGCTAPVVVNTGGTSGVGGGGTGATMGAGATMGGGGLMGGGGTTF